MDDEVYADGTPANAAPFPIDSVPVSAFLAAASKKPPSKRIPANPTAAEIHMKESGAPWRERYDRQIEAENRKAAAEIQQARITGLARQTCVGLDRVYGVKVDYTTLAARLTDAFKAKDRLKAATSMGDEKGSAPDAATSKELLLIDAVLRYDLVKVAALLELRLPDKSIKTLTG